MNRTGPRTHLAPFREHQLRRRAELVAACARHLAPGGRLVAGFQLQEGWPTLAEYDGWCDAAGLAAEDRWSSWDRDPYTGGDYALSVHTA